MARRLIDLTTPVTTGHFRWPVERRLLKSHAEGAGQGTWAGWNVHGFTHMDSPRHVDPEGFTTDAITPEMTRRRQGANDCKTVADRLPQRQGRHPAATAEPPGRTGPLAASGAPC